MHRSLYILFLFCCHLQAQPPYTIKNGVPYMEKGIPASPLWFADSRLAFNFDEGGVGQLDYYSPAPGQNLPTVFLRQLWDGFRYYLVKDGKTYKPDFNNSSIWPFGIESDWHVGSAVFRQQVMAVDESLIIEITTPDTIPEGMAFKLEFYEAFGLSRGSDDDLRYTNGRFSRQWMPWQFEANGNQLTGGFHSQLLPETDKKGVASFDTYCTISADFPLTHLPREINPKHILHGPELKGGKTYRFVISFGNNKEELKQRSKQQVGHCEQLVTSQFDRYKAVVAQSPALESRYTSLNNFVSLAPLYHESLKIKGHPGAMRAKTTNYWVWGWDGMTCNAASAYWGDTTHIREMLNFYEATADTAKGIGHAFEYDMQPASISALPAQSMYVSLLQLYYQQTRDINTVRRRYPFARKIFNRIAEKEVRGTGMCEGSSLFPDFPVAMEETGKDISGFNNTIYYAATRSMEWLAGLVKDKEQQKKAASIARRIERNFVPLFFDKKKGFVISSIDAVTLRKRDSYNINSIRWENKYCSDLTHSIDSACLSFFSKNAVTPMGIREIPLWSKSYDRDANQLHCWWPATGEYYMRLINGFDKPAMIDEWINWVSYWTNSLSCPEGISNYIETSEPEFDRWTSQKGAWQAYSTRAWYQAVFHSVVGVDVDPGGITLYPYSGQEMVLRRMHYMERQIDLHMKGSGPYIDSVVVDGKKILATHKIPEDIYRSNRHPVIKVYRSKTRSLPVTILSADAMRLEDYRFNGKSIRMVGSCNGLVRLRLRADHLPVVKANGRRLKVDYEVTTQEAVVELAPGERLRLAID